MANFPASLLILNGKSADNQPLREAITLLRDEGIQIHVRVTREKGDAQRYVDEARRLGVETVIAGGGDGTINEVSTALIQIRDGVALHWAFCRSAPPTILPPAPVFLKRWTKR